MMTDQQFRMFMIGQRYITACTGLYIATITAHDKGACAAAVEKDNRLFTGVQGGVQF